MGKSEQKTEKNSATGRKNGSAGSEQKVEPVFAHVYLSRWISFPSPGWPHSNLFLRMAFRHDFSLIKISIWFFCLFVWSGHFQRGIQASVFLVVIQFNALVFLGMLLPGSSTGSRPREPGVSWVINGRWHWFGFRLFDFRSTNVCSLVIGSMSSMIA